MNETRTQPAGAAPVSRGLPQRGGGDNAAGKAGAAGHLDFLLWATMLQHNNGRNEKVIKVLKTKLRREADIVKPIIRMQLKFAKKQHELMERPY